MKSLKLTIKGMHCEACEKNIKRALSNFDHIKDINLKFNNENAEIFYNPEINVNEVIKIIKNLGYDASEKISRKVNFNHFLNELFSGNNIEKEVLLLFFNILIILTISEIVAYLGFFGNVENFFDKIGYFLIYLILSVVALSSSVWHIKAYSSDFSCMSGMMIGMTIGMLSGFLIGAVIGATNGIFIGSVIGIIMGMSIGSWCGNCCGIMGILEGMMAGLMGGLMGPMTSLMLINDNLKLIFPVIFVASFLIIFGLDYMIFKETKSKDITNFYKYNKFNFITFCFVITMLLTFIMVYGPKSALFR